QLAGEIGDLLLQFGNGRRAPRRSRWRLVALRASRLAVLRLRGFAAYCATPSHVALPVAEALLTYHIVRAVVQHSKINLPGTASGHKPNLPHRNSKVRFRLKELTCPQADFYLCRQPAGLLAAMRRRCLRPRKGG